MFKFLSLPVLHSISLPRYYNFTKADGHPSIVTLITALEDSKLVRLKHLSKSGRSARVVATRKEPIITLGVHPKRTVVICYYSDKKPGLGESGRKTLKERTQTYLPMQYIVLISNTDEERFKSLNLIC